MPSPDRRYLDVTACAAYIGRTAKAVYHLVSTNSIPHMRLGRKVQFDTERLDAWMGRHARRGKMV